MSTSLDEAPAKAAQAATQGPTAEVARDIRRAAIAAAALGVVLSPIPLADEIVLLPAYGLLTAKIAASRRMRLRAVPWRPIALTALAGLGARAAVNVAVSYVPLLAAAANAVTAAALTTVLGRYVDSACEDAAQGRAVDALGCREIADALRARPSRA
jgi:uncharacterized protein (DUF697 family)